MTSDGVRARGFEVPGIRSLGKWLWSKVYLVLHPLPRVVQLTELAHLAPGGCTFEVRNEVEEFRIVRFGGERAFLERLLGMLGIKESAA